MGPPEGRAPARTPRLHPTARLVDTHCHLADPALAGDLTGILARAREAGVGHIIAIGETPERAEDVLRLARDLAVSATAGLHPHEADRWSEALAQSLESMARDPAIVAIGETGLDYHYDHAPRARQREAFDAQLDLARRMDKPAVIHARSADDDLITLLRNHPGTRVVMHSFSSSERLLDVALELGHAISLSGMLTFRSWHLDAAVARIPVDRVLLETDAPYLAPVPQRGTRNEPAFLVHTAARLANLLGCSLEAVGELTSANAARVFGARVSSSLALPPGGRP